MQADGSLQNKAGEPDTVQVWALGPAPSPGFWGPEPWSLVGAPRLSKRNSAPGGRVWAVGSRCLPADASASEAEPESLASAEDSWFLSVSPFQLRMGKLSK